MEYAPNFESTGRFLRTSAGLRQACRVGAGEIRGVARSMAPVDQGNYRESMVVLDMVPTDRVGAVLMADDPAAAPLEFGNVNTGGVGRAILSRAAEAAGFDVQAGE